MARPTLVMAVVLVCLTATALADVYMHNPRGSNNRLNERSANRNNGNRMFDSQNNNRGGYNKGDKTDEAAGNDEDKQYHMTYYMSAKGHRSGRQGASMMSVEWTNQHGCGGNEHNDPHKLNCNLILQYMCVPETLDNSDDPELARDRPRDDCTMECYIPHSMNPNCDRNGLPCKSATWITTAGECDDAGYVWGVARFYNEFNCPHKCSGAEQAHTKQQCDILQGSWGSYANAPQNTRHRLRDGTTTNRQDYTQPNNNALSEQDRFDRMDGDVRNDRGLHESWEWYDECYRRERNAGLFTADQRLRSNSLGYSSAVFTRQNPNDNRRGYECPEERDYWPYWHPSPWVDIAIMTDREDLCPFFQAESQNVKPKWACRNTENCENCIRFNNKDDCVENGGAWEADGSHDVPPPECMQSPWSRVNHLGNGRDGKPNMYNWTLPYLHVGSPNSPKEVPFKCVLRLRYNMTTDDYDAWRVNASFNNNDGQGIISPVRQNPNVDIGAKTTALRLAINTAQFGRTFQDRSHVFRLVPRPSSAVTSNRVRSAAAQNDDDLFGKRTLWNLNVRGKRGNIVQTFPSVEYDFQPNHLHIKEDDLVHIQWTGSNTHNNGNPAGDGQAGDAGEGRGGTDRHNLVELHTNRFMESFPVTWEEARMFKTGLLDAFDANDETRHYYSQLDQTQTWAQTRMNWALRLASSGYYGSYNHPNDPSSVTQRTEELNELLNNAPASFRGGVFRFAKGSYNYMCTRNHNFSNRDQKGHLRVE